MGMHQKAKIGTGALLAINAMPVQHVPGLREGKGRLGGLLEDGHLETPRR